MKPWTSFKSEKYRSACLIAVFLFEMHRFSSTGVAQSSIALTVAEDINRVYYAFQIKLNRNLGEGI